MSRVPSPARPRALALLVALVVLALAACGGQTAQPRADGEIDEDGLHGNALTDPYQVPAGTLVDTDGSAYSLTDADADLTLVFFGYTHCPDICQVVMGTIASALTRLDDADRDRVDVVFVTTDPARDDPEVLRAYLDRFDPQFQGVTGELPEIIDTAAALAVHVEEGEELPSGGYEVVHSDPVIGLDDSDRATVIWTKDVSSAQLAEDITVLLSETTDATDGS